MELAKIIYEAEIVDEHEEAILRWEQMSREHWEKEECEESEE